MDSRGGSVYREQGYGDFSQEVWRLVSILIKDSHHQNLMNVFDRAAETDKLGQVVHKNKHTFYVPIFQCVV